MNFPPLDPASIQKIDAVGNIPTLLQVGRAAAEDVDIGHFGLYYNINGEAKAGNALQKRSLIRRQGERMA